MPPGDMCAICGQRPARYWSNAIAGPVTLRVTGYCAPCNEVEMAANESECVGAAPDAEPTAADIEAQMMRLGPIDFELLARQLPVDAPTVGEGTDDLRYAAWIVARIAAHHGQVLPPDIAAFVSRHGSDVPRAT